MTSITLSMRQAQQQVRAPNIPYPRNSGKSSVVCSTTSQHQYNKHMPPPKGTKRKLNSRKILNGIVAVSFLCTTWVYVAVFRHSGLAEQVLFSRGLQQQTPPPSPRRLGMLIGIFTADMPNDRVYRSRHRKLFTIWDDPRVCTLYNFEARSESERQQCEVIYTFIVGANPNGPTEWIQEDEDDDGTRSSNPILVPSDTTIDWMAPDLNNRDVTRLNIRENMNEGKSPTFFKLAYQLMERYEGSIDYAMKLDADSILHLHEFFRFAYRHLPPTPYSDNSYVGALRDKAYWPKKNRTKEELSQIEGFFGSQFEGVHLYLAGQCYILSKNLAQVVLKESQLLYQNRLTGSAVNHTSPYISYLEGHEDHDIAAMVAHSPEPIHMITVRRQQRFWEHPVKGQPRWKRIWSREVARMEGRKFERQLYSKESSFESVMGKKEDPWW